MDEVYYAVPTPKNIVWRRIIILGILGVLIIFAMYWVIEFLTIGQIVVSTDNPAAKLTLTKIPGQSLIKQSTGTLAIGARTGTYSVSVVSNSSASSQIITVKAHKTLRYTIHVPNPVGVEPVSYSTAAGIIASASQLYFLNAAGNLSGIGASNNQLVIDSSTQFQSIRWATSTFGIGADSKGGLYTISGGIPRPLAFSEPHDSADLPVYAVSASHQIYVALGSSVYSGTLGGSFKKIYTAVGDPTALIAGNDEAVVISNPDNDNGQKNKAASTPAIAIVSAAGKVIRASIGTSVAALSPHEKYLAVGDAVGGEILNSSLKSIATVPQSNFSNPVWLDENDLFYSVNDQVWTYNVTDQKAQLLANAPLGGTITELSLSDDNSYLYMGVTQTAGSPVIKRIGLQNQPVPSSVYQLQTIMPYSGSGYFATLINFTKPTVLIVPSVPLINTDSQYVQEAKTQFAQQGIDLGQISVLFKPPS